jgi:LPS-assembly lipoprotein
MWWLRRLTLALGLLALAGGQSGCGFQPVYGGGGERGAAADELQHIAIDTVPDRVGYRLKSELERLFGNHGQQTDYRLAIDLDTRSSVTAIDSDDSTLRRNLRLVAAVALIPVGSEEPVYQKTLISDAGIDQLPSDFATLVAEDAAEERAVQRLARDIRQRLAVHFASQR